MTAEQQYTAILPFLDSIGIPVEFVKLEEETFLPGVKISKGRLLVDRDILKHPGDLLHEAGHIAVLTPEERAVEEGNLLTEQNPAESREMAVICWSWAALLKTGLPVEILFHADGYKGQADWLGDQFKAGTYIGLPLLQYYGLTWQKPDPAFPERKIFPEMEKWLR